MPEQGSVRSFAWLAKIGLIVSKVVRSPVFAEFNNEASIDDNANF